MPLTPYQRDILTRTVLGEAGGEGDQGMSGVAWVIRNRTSSGDFPSDPASVARQGGRYHQFSAWNAIADGGNNLVNTPSTSAAYQRAQAIVDQVFDGSSEDPTHGATYYYAPAGMSGGAPSWAAGMTPTVTIGGQRFFADHPVPTAGIPAAANSSGAPDERSLFAASGTALPAPSPRYRNTLGPVNEFNPLPAPAPLVAAVGLGRPANAPPTPQAPIVRPSSAIRQAVGLAGPAAPAPAPAPAPSQASRPGSGAQTGVTTITVRPDGSTSSNEGGMAGSSSLPPGVRPNVPVIADSPSQVSTDIPKYVTTTEKVPVHPAAGGDVKQIHTGANVQDAHLSDGVRDATHAANVQQVASTDTYKTVTRTILNPQWIRAQQAPVVKVAPAQRAVGINAAPAPAAAPGTSFLAARGINVANAPAPVQANALRDQLSGGHGEGHFGL